MVERAIVKRYKYQVVLLGDFSLQKKSKCLFERLAGTISVQADKVRIIWPDTVWCTTMATIPDVQ